MFKGKRRRRRALVTDNSNMKGVIFELWPNLDGQGGTTVTTTNNIRIRVLAHPPKPLDKVLLCITHGDHGKQTPFLWNAQSGRLANRSG